MKAVGYKRALPIDDPESLLDVTLPEPEPQPHDLVVDVKAVSVNPVDYKVRQSTNPPSGEIKVLGWDAAGVVRATGRDVTLFRPGDNVWYAGSIARPGTNAERHLVDERIVGKLPTKLSFAQAAALPLTSLTAWELLFDRLQVLQNPSSVGDQLLVIGASGGVGSILVQLARKLTRLTLSAQPILKAKLVSVLWGLTTSSVTIISARNYAASVFLLSLTWSASLTRTRICKRSAK